MTLTEINQRFEERGWPVSLPAIKRQLSGDALKAATRLYYERQSLKDAEPKTPREPRAPRAPRPVEYVSVYGDSIRETERAMLINVRLIRDGGVGRQEFRETWVPKSAVKSAEGHRFEIAEWKVNEMRPIGYALAQDYLGY